MDLSRLRPVYEHDGPFATVYMEGRAPSEDAEKQVRLRWQALRERLEEAGADPRAVAAAERSVLSATAGEEQANGRVIVASGDSGVVLDESWDAALGAGDEAHWGHLPELGAYGREAARAVRALVVLTDQEGARVIQEVVAEQHTSETRADDEVEGSAIEALHKPRRGALSHNQIQRRADNAVSRNAEDIAAYVTQSAEAFHPRVVILAGEVQARTAVRNALPPPVAERLVETGRGGGGRDDYSSDADDALNDEILRIAAEESEREGERCAGRLQAGLAHDQAAQGSSPVAAAAEMGAVDTLLFEEGATASREAFLLKACTETSSALAVVPAGTGLQDGVGALLRFPIEESTPG